MSADLERNEYKSGSDIIEFVRSKLGISESMLAALLRVTTSTLDDWKRASYPGGLLGKGVRLKALYDFIVLADKAKVDSSEMLRLLDAPLDSEDEESRSLLFYIVEGPQDLFLRSLAMIVIEKFISEGEER